MGGFVLVRLHPLRSMSRQRSAKLDFRWFIPLIVARFVSPVTVLLVNPDTGVIISYLLFVLNDEVRNTQAHVSQLKPYFWGNDLFCVVICSLF